MYDDGYVNGYVQRERGGQYLGKLNIDSVNIGGIIGVYFTKNGKTYLWLKRKKVIEYDERNEKFTEREARPKWEAYLEKQVQEGTVAYKGEFFFLRFKYSIIGVWDRILGKDKQRLNLYVERLPMQEQTIINAISNRKNESNGFRAKGNG